MNKLYFYLQLVNSDIKVLDGFRFSNIAFIKLLIDDKDIFKDFPTAVIVFEELKDSMIKSGEYLIFTCICGIANDLNVSLVKVTHKKHTIEWKFSLRENIYKFEFKRVEYLEEIKNLRSEIKKLPPNIILEPLYYAYPEK